MFLYKSSAPGQVPVSLIDFWGSVFVGGDFFDLRDDGPKVGVVVIWLAADFLYKTIPGFGGNILGHSPM